MVNRITGRLLDGLFPSYCSLCKWRCPGPLPLCPDCRDELPANDHACRLCASPLAPATSGVCGTCLQSPPAFDRAIAPWLYGEYLAYLVHRWKFSGARHLTTLLADLWLQQVATPPAVDAVVPVPLHWLRHWRRGYNQAELLAAALQRRRPQLQLATGLLQRSRRTAAQSSMTAEARRRNLKGAFTAAGGCANLRLAVVDDVLTTGATAEAVASALKASGASHVEIWCLARTPSPGD